jgi:undecaprenyl-diphosphatase
MLQTIENIDLQLFHYLNHQWRNEYLDLILPYCREPKTWIPLYLLLIYIVVKNFKTKSLRIILFIALTAAAADVVSSRVIKPLVHRLRPCNEPTLKGETINIVPCGSGYSYTSSHAANHFALAMSISLFVFFDKKNTRRLLFLWASLIAYAQVYVGVHYPFDVISGALLGVAIAIGIYNISKNT